MERNVGRPNPTAEHQALIRAQLSAHRQPTFCVPVLPAQQYRLLSVFGGRSTLALRSYIL